MADVGFLGFPNAGKSTLLRAVSRARPKVAGYPFTTLKPHLGMVPYDDGEQVAVADIPGIIKDAHKNKGLGIDFLRHVERCSCLLYVIDMSQPDPIDQFESLKHELRHYRADLPDRPHAVVANKMDVEGAEDSLKAFKSQLDANLAVFEISGKYGRNLAPLLLYMRREYDKRKENYIP